MQPDEKKPFQEPYIEPEQTGGPVVTLTPDSAPSVEAPQAATDVPMAPEAGPAVGPIRWQAAEFVHRDRDQMWFIIFLLITLGLIAVAIFIIKSLTFAVLVPVMAAALFIYTRHPPRMLDYTLSRHGLYINDLLFSFGEFKSFALMQGVDHHSIILIPTQRFKPAVTINFPEEVGEAIVDMLAARLPMREMQPDLVDQIIRKLHL